MPQIFVRCYAELNDLLPKEMQFSTFPLSLLQNTLVQVLIERIGLPLEAIDLVLVNGEPVDLSHSLEANDYISLYPVFESFDISSIEKLHEHPLRQLRFVLDVHLGKLANHLRMFGFDTLYQNNYSDKDLLSSSINEKRILLSKDKSLLDNKSLTRAFLVKEKVPQSQLIEVFDRFDLYTSVKPFTRCITCNTLLQRVEKQSILTRIPDKVIKWCDEYQWCTKCDRIYWKGSHYVHMQSFIHDILQRHFRNNSSD